MGLLLLPDASISLISPSCCGAGSGLSRGLEGPSLPLASVGPVDGFLLRFGGTPEWSAAHAGGLTARAPAPGREGSFLPAWPSCLGLPAHLCTDHDHADPRPPGRGPPPLGCRRPIPRGPSSRVEGPHPPISSSTVLWPCCPSHFTGLLLVNCPLCKPPCSAYCQAWLLVDCGSCNYMSL